MANINEIAKETLLILKERGLKPTPENYTEIFEELALKNGMSAGTKEKIAKFKALLIPNSQDEIQLQKMKNIDEFLSFLISKLNRQGREKGVEFFGLLTHILKMQLSSKDKKLKDMASTTLGQLSKTMESESIYLIEKKWSEWANAYKDDKEIESKLAEYGIKFDDFASTIAKLLIQLKAHSYKRFVRLLALCLQPSLTQNEKLKNFEQKLRDKPYILGFDSKNNDEFYNELTQMVNKRVSADMIFVQRNLSFFDENLRKLSGMLDSLMSLNQKNISSINSLKAGKDGRVSVGFEELKSKFEALSDKFASISRQVSSMNDSKEREEWSLQSHILKLDEQFLQNGDNYALCVFSISNYRFIIEKYGLKNLNEILTRFRRILKDNCDKNDELWMLDEKSYLLIIYNRTYNKIIEVMQKNVAQLENFKFIYKDEVIKPKIINFCMDKDSYPHINILDELTKKIEQ